MSTRLGPKARAIAQEMTQAQDKLHEESEDYLLNCNNNPEQYVDFDIPPSNEVAAEMCEGCPLYDRRTGGLCRKYAKATKKTWGVWGGKVFLPPTLKIKNENEEAS